MARQPPGGGLPGIDSEISPRRNRAYSPTARFMECVAFRTHPFQAQVSSVEQPWASQLQHAVQSMDGDANLGGAAAVLAKAQTVTDHLFVASDGGLNPAALGVARHLLPADPALFGNALQMTVPPGGRGSGRLAQHRRGAWRHDDRSVGVAVDHGAIEAILVVGAVA